MHEEQLTFKFNQSPLYELSDYELRAIRKAISLRWKGMANRANYQDMSEVVGIALRKSPMSVEDKREFAITVADELHGRCRHVVRDMTVDHICRIAGVPFERIESALYAGDRYPYRGFSVETL